MKFKTKGIGARYRGEEGTAGVRRTALRGLEAILRRAYQESDELREFARGRQVASRLPRVGRGRVKALVEFHEGQQSKEIEADRQDEEVIRIRTWLHRQNARLTPEGKIIWPSSRRVVVYDHQLEAREHTRITFDGGRLLTEDGGALDTARMVTHFSGPGYAIYVVSEEGNLHVSSHSVGHRHHSSLLAGGAVAGAGELKVSEGRLLWISNKSGHYQPDVFHLYQTLRRLASEGVRAGFQVYVLPAGTLYRDVDEFMRQEGAFLEPDFENLQESGRGEYGVYRNL